MPASNLTAEQQLAAAKQQAQTLSKQYQATNGESWTPAQQDQVLGKIIVENGYDKLSIGSNSPNTLSFSQPYITGTTGFTQTNNIASDGSVQRITGVDPETGNAIQIPPADNPVAVQNSLRTTSNNTPAGTDGGTTSTATQNGNPAPEATGTTDTATPGGNTNQTPGPTANNTDGQVIGPGQTNPVVAGVGEDNSNGGNTGGTGNVPLGPDQVTVSGGSGLPAANNNANTGSDVVRPNKLHSYTNYTYRISVHLVPQDSINLMYTGLNSGDEESLLQNSIFMVADSGLGEYSRSEYFPVDLGIDNLELQTIVGTTTRTRGSDVIKIKFEIIEPYTVNFLARLQLAAKQVNPQGTWETTFFVMKIQFFGYSDEGTPTEIPDTRKYIPFTMVNMKFVLNASGAVYYVDAIPTSQMSQTVLDNQIPFHVEVQGGTVQDLFSGTLTTDTQAAKDIRNDVPGAASDAGSGTGTGTSYVIKGLDKALNNAEDQKCDPKNKGQTLPNRYHFQFEDKLGTAKIAKPDVFKEQATTMASGKDQQAIAKGKVGQLTADFTNNTFRAQSGTKITDFINSVMTLSSFMTDQYNQAGQGNNNPLYTWKITPVVKWGDIDPATNYYQREVKFVVQSYMIKGQDAPGFGQQAPDNTDVVKQYDYIYSGNNRDVINANIEYKMAFFEIKNGVPTNYIKRANDAPGQQPQDLQGPQYDGSGDNRIFKPKYHYVFGVANRQNTGSATASEANIRVGELMEKLYDNDGDMIQLEIVIVGDPDWIDQDVPLFGPIVGQDPYIPGGSVNFTRQAYFRFNFSTPNSDYDNDTGMFGLSNPYSSFSGIYNVIQVKSNFVKGKFTQQLTNVRSRTQSTPATGSVRVESTQPAVSRNNNGSTPQSPAEQPNVTVQAPNRTQNQNQNSGSTIAPQGSPGVVEDAPLVGI
jgi:hypothetical protein